MTLGFEMAAIIGLATFLGQKIDEKINDNSLIATIALSLLAVFATTYLLIKRITNDKK